MERWKAIFASVSIIFGAYIIWSFISEPKKDPQDNHPYHIGCYDISNPLNNSQDIAAYIHTLNHELNTSSVNQVLKMDQKLQQTVVTAKAANDIASEFQKYIVSYENIRSRNKYEQNFYDGLKKAREDFYQCRQSFNAVPWDCNGTYERHSKLEEEFLSLKAVLNDKISLKFSHQDKIENFLKDETTIEDDEYSEKYRKEMDEQNRLLAIKEEQLKIESENLIMTDNSIFERGSELNDTKKMLIDCKINKNEIDYCKNISENIKLINQGINIDQIHRKIIKKRQILERQQSALAKTRKLNEDVGELLISIAVNKRELEQLEDLYKESESIGLCANEINFKCSDSHIKELELNLTNIKVKIDELHDRKITIITKVTLGEAEKEKILKKIKILDEELDAKVGSFKSFEHTQTQQIEKLRLYRQVMNNINKDILELKAELSSIRARRQTEHRNIDRILSRVGEISNCLSKKQFYLKLKSRKPKNAEQDEKLKREAAESLIAAITKNQRQLQ